jgi:hypothetical protein
VDASQSKDKLWTYKRIRPNPLKVVSYTSSRTTRIPADESLRFFGLPMLSAVGKDYLRVHIQLVSKAKSLQNLPSAHCRAHSESWLAALSNKPIEIMSRPSCLGPGRILCAACTTHCWGAFVHKLGRTLWTRRSENIVMIVDCIADSPHGWRKDDNFMIQDFLKQVYSLKTDCKHKWIKP